MAQIAASVDSPSILCVTPLYHFASDATELCIEAGIRISRYDALSTATNLVIAKHLQFHPPDYLLWQEPLLSQDVSVDDFLSIYNGPDAGNEKWARLVEFFLAPATLQTRTSSHG